MADPAAPIGGSGTAPARPTIEQLAAAALRRAAITKAKDKTNAL